MGELVPSELFPYAGRGSVPLDSLSLSLSFSARQGHWASCLRATFERVAVHLRTSTVSGFGATPTAKKCSRSTPTATFWLWGWLQSHLHSHKSLVWAEAITLNLEEDLRVEVFGVQFRLQ